MKLHHIFVAGALALATAGVASADMMEDEEEKSCVPTGLDGQICAVSEDAYNDWTDGDWSQVGENTWINETDGSVSTWVEIAPNEYEIVDPVEQASQQGLTIPLEPVDDGYYSGGDFGEPHGYELPSGEVVCVEYEDVPTEEAIVTYEGPSGAGDIGAITAGEGEVSARWSPYGLTRLVAKAPSGLQLEEFELVWAIYKTRLRMDLWRTRNQGRVTCALFDCGDDGTRDDHEFEPAAWDGYVSAKELERMNHGGDAFHDAVAAIDRSVEATEMILRNVVRDRARVQLYIEKLKELVGPRPPEGMHPVAVFHDTIEDVVVEGFVSALMAHRRSGFASDYAAVQAMALAPAQRAYFAARPDPWSAPVSDAELAFDWLEAPTFTRR
jgi:hypothetical protein